MIAKAPFGKTGRESSRTLFGAAAFWAVTQAEADQTLDVLLAHGVNHIDTAASYGDSELRIGPWMKRHRGDFFLASKTGERTYAKARDQIRKSLERLQTDHLDLIQLHAVTEMSDLEIALGPDGALRAAVEARDEGLVRFIGLTSHSLTAPDVLIRALNSFEFTSVLLPYNYPMMQIPQYAAGFNRVIATCRERGVAVQAIKSICRRPWAEGQEHFAACWYEPLIEPAAVEKAVAYVLAQPGFFLSTVGDIHVLPAVLEAAERLSGRRAKRSAAEAAVEGPSDAEMRELVAKYEMRPLWPEHEGAH